MSQTESQPQHDEHAQRVDVSVLTPVLNEAEHVRECARTMQAQEFDGELEFIFIDGGSDDGTPDIIREIAAGDPRFRLLENPAKRTPQGLNVGLRASRGEFVARMDAHTLYPPTYLATGVARLRRGDVASVSGPQLPYGQGTWSRRVALALGSRMGVGGASFRTESQDEFEVDTGFTGVWAKSTLDAQGGWDEGWPVNQDSELAARIRGDGGRIVCIPEMAAQYIPRNSLRSLVRQYRRYGEFRAKTGSRHPTGLRRSHALPPGTVVVVAANLAPLRPVRRAARLATVAYAGALSVEAARLAARTGPRDAAFLPVIWASMHLSWGAGFLYGATKYRMPLRSLRRLVGI